MGVDDMPAPPPHIQQPLSHSSFSQPLSPLYAKERLIIQQLIRHGEKTIDNAEEEVQVAALIATEFEADGITFETPLFVQIFQEALQHLNDEGFIAERYFINHPNPEISKLAVDLAEEKYQLSKYHSKTQTVASEVDRLGEIIPHLLVDYKMSILELELKETLNQLRLPEVMNNPELSFNVMTRYKELMEVKQQMAKVLGDRVIGA